MEKTKDDIISKKRIENILDSFSKQHSNLHFSSDTLILTIIGTKGNLINIDFDTNYFNVVFDWGDEKSVDYSLSKFNELSWEERSLFWQSLMRKGDYLLNGSKIGTFGSEFIVKVKPIIIKIQQNILPKIDKILEEEEEKKKKEQEKFEEQRLKELKVSQTSVLSAFDKDGNGEVDVVEGNDFNILLKKHQKTIIDVDRNYVQQFVKVSSYLKMKKGNIQSIFNSIKDIPNQEMLNEYVEILKDDIHTYNLVLFNSLNMIVSLVEDDMITFYEIHEMFDNLNMFDSKHEKDVSQKLINIGDGLKDLMYEVRRMGNQISDSIHELSYVTKETNTQLTNQLSEIDSSINVGNLISVINTYQNYKTNRRLNS